MALHHLQQRVPLGLRTAVTLSSRDIGPQSFAPLRAAVACPLCRLMVHSEFFPSKLAQYISRLAEEP